MNTIIEASSVISNADAPAKSGTDWGALLGGIASGIGVAVKKPDTYVTNTDNNTSTSGSSTGIYVGIGVVVVLLVIAIIFIVKRSK